ncbi:hypothetical protein L2E82_00661 [Cichorium intybus]|uniref:Uncharacterized protein n=1 Tax=Cichorium intybus TaxID=13427 RepID=A0ACB9GXI7_CICIN|nr:hypothetical protein L2E82_00661 [Cichorium intybus]
METPLPTQLKNNLKRHKSVDWFDYINKENLKLAIPIGPRFQADVPEWSGPLHKSVGTSCKWLGTVIWSMETQEGGDIIGKGRPESCNCASRGSIMCVKRHIAQKSADLQKDLGPAFQKWKFDQMGESVAKLWKQPEQQKLTHLMKRVPLSEGMDFIKPALECFPLKSKKDIVSYYLNVYVPRRMSVQTRSGCIMVDTDDEEKSKSPFPKVSRKRARADGSNGTAANGQKLGLTKYLTGRR